MVSRSEVLNGEYNGRDHYLLKVSEQQFNEFQALLDRPAQHNEGLERLFTRVAPWEAAKEDRVPSDGH